MQANKHKYTELLTYMEFHIVHVLALLRETLSCNVFAVEFTNLIDVAVLVKTPSFDECGRSKIPINAPDGLKSA